MKKNSFVSLVWIAGVCVFTACAPKSFEANQQVASDTASSIGCSNFESKAWDAVNRYLIEQKKLPVAADLKESLREILKEKNLDALAPEIEELYDILLVEAPQVEGVKDSQELLRVLTALELGDHTTENKIKLQNRVQTQFAKIEKKSKIMTVACEEPDVNEPDPELVKTTLPLPVYGMRFTFATAYQTCQALDEPIMSESTTNIAENAITITGKHSDGVGSKRVISSINSLLHSHPYYKNVNNYARGCLKGSSYPMIYDYGGKPYATTSFSSTLDFFKDSGGGTSALGADCSGFVYAGLATAGLRLSPGKSLKAVDINGISSAMYVEPEKNGLSCLGKISLTPKSSLHAGDIVAVPGHVFMIDSVGTDPFGLNGARTVEDCGRLEPKNFNFVIIQSSPSKNAVGMNRYQARDYLYESDKMREGLTRYAYYACLARITNKKYTPSLGTISVIRHKLTPNCLGTRIKLAHESCIQSCPQLAR